MAIISAFPDKSKPRLQEKTVSPATSAVEVKADSKFDGLGKCTVSAVDMAVGHIHGDMSEDTSDGNQITILINKTDISENMIKDLDFADILMVRLLIYAAKNESDDNVLTEAILQFAMSSKTSGSCNYRYLVTKDGSAKIPGPPVINGNPQQYFSKFNVQSVTSGWKVTLSDISPDMTIKVASKTYYQHQVFALR